MAGPWTAVAVRQDESRTGLPAGERNQAERSRALLAALPLTDGGPILLAYTRRHAQEAAMLCAIARESDIDVRLLGLGRWDPEQFLRRLGEFARMWPPTVPRLGVLLYQAEIDQRELADLMGFSLLHATDFPPDQIGSGAGMTGQALRLPGNRQLIITGPQGRKLVLTRRTPLRWSSWPSDCAGRIVRWPTSAWGHTAIETAEGHFVADLSWHVNRHFRGSMWLAGAPVLLAMRDGLITQLSCADPHVRGFLGRAVSVHGANRAVALAIGGHVRGRPEVTVTVAGAGGGAFSAASADLRLELSSASCVVTVDAASGRRVGPGEG